MFRFPTQLHQICGPISIVVIACLTMLTVGVLGETLIYERPAIQDWQLWRLITGNVMHSNLNHLLLNLLGVILLWALHGDYYKTWNYLGVVLVCGVGTSLGLYLFEADIVWYVGLSGALHGLFVWGAIMDIKHKLTSGWLLLLGIIIKIGYELIFGASDSLADWIEASVAVEAHLYGAVSGAIAGVIWWVKDGKE